MNQDAQKPIPLSMADTLGEDDSFLFSRFTLPSHHRTDLRCHGYYEMTIIEDGAALHHINAKTQALTQGDVLFIRPSDTHSFETGEAGCKLMTIMFRTNTADDLIARYRRDLSERFFWSQAPLPSRVHLKGAQLERAINTSGTMRTTLQTRLRLDHFLITMMTFVLDDVARISPSAPGWLVEACIAAQSPEVFRRGGAGFIDAAGRGAEHVSRQTKKYLGITPTRYVNQIRVQHAAMRLRQGAHTLADIAEDAGFETLSYFHRLFKEQYGCTPDTYRRRHLKAPLPSTDS